MCKMLAAITLVFLATVSANAQSNTFKLSNGVEVTVTDLAPDQDFTTINAQYTIKVPANAVEPCSSLILTPVIKDGDNKKLAEVIVVNGTGKLGSIKWLEGQIFSVCDPNYVRFFTLKEGETLVINSSNAFPLEGWIEDGATFYVTSQKVTYNPNCIKAYPGEEKVCAVPYLVNPYKITPIFTATPADAQFQTERAVRTKLFYPVNGTKQVDDYLDNPDALRLLSTLDKDNYQVLSINIQGWASPESSVAYNKNLSVNRAKTMKNIIAKKYSFDDKVYTTEGNGEYWQEAIDFINSTSDPVVVASRSAIQDAVASNSDLDKREAAIKKIDGGKPYKVIFDNSYPRSRFAECVVTYNVKIFDVDDAMVIFESDPESLSADDYVALLNMERDAQVVAKGLELYPNDPRINAIAGDMAVAQKDYKAAVNYYKKSGNSPEVFNNLGCCSLLAGDTDAAKEYFKKAEQLPESEYNAVLIRKAALNKRYFNK